MVSGNIYEEDFRKGKYDEKAVICFINSHRDMGDFSSDEVRGKHFILKKMGKLKYCIY